MADLPSILGGMAQGFLDFGKSAVDLFGTGGAAVGDLVDTIRTGKVSTKNQDDFRKWLYNTDSVQDAAAKGLGTALNGVQTVTDYIPGIGAVTRNPLFNAGQGALGGLADEFKTYGKDYDLGRAAQRAAVSAGGALASTGLADALKSNSNSLLKSATAQGLGRGAVGGAITGGGYAAIDGGDVMQGALQGAGTGALIGGATGAVQDIMPRGKLTPAEAALTDDERQARLKEVRKMRNAIGSEKAYMSGTLDEASENRWSELYNLEQAYKNGFDNYNDYHNTLRPTKGLDDETLGLVLKNMEEPELQPWMQKGSHQPTFDPAMSSLASSMDRTINGEEFMPNDFYEHMDWYGGGDTKPYLESAQAIQKIKGNPNAKVTMYRATVGDTIYPNDWVTLSPEYAKLHLANALRDQPDAKIIKQTVAARDLRWPGDDINEFGYYPVTNGDIARAKNLETTLSADDMAVNNPKLTSSSDIMLSKALPEDAGLAKTLSKSDEAINRIGSKDVAPIDPSTLPEGWGEFKSFLSDYDTLVEKEIGKPRGKITKQDLAKALEEYGYDTDGTKDQMWRNLHTALVDNRVDDMYMNNAGTPAQIIDMYRQSPQLINPGRLSLDGNSRTARLDAELSDRLGIGRSNTPMADTTVAIGTGGAQGDYSNGALGTDPLWATGENGISTVAHERFHSMQNEGLNWNYDEEFRDAMNELRSELAPLYHSKEEISKYWNGRKPEYYHDYDEQEARMLQDYLERKNYTQRYMNGKRSYEYDEKIIKPFDKFFDKLRDLSKRGVALPAITALLGGGAYMASQDKDKETK